MTTPQPAPTPTGPAAFSRGLPAPGEPLLAQIQSVAEAAHRSVDEVLTDAVKRYVKEHSWTKLLDYGAERAKTPGIKESDIDRLITESRAEQHSH